MTVELPRHLTEEQVEQLARESDTLLEFSREVRISRMDAGRLLHHLGIDADFDKPADELVRQSRQNDA